MHPALLYIKNSNTDPFFNLALEEYVLKNVTDDALIIWKNRPSVVVGKHQNAYKESAYFYCKENDIDIARRISGGGTVYHDEGNLNFSVILSKAPEKALNVNLKMFIEPVADALILLGFDARLSDRNDIFVNDKKVSGNAQHLFQSGKKVLHHGTVLLNANMANLSASLKGNRDRFTTKAVESVRSPVLNLFELKKEVHETDIIETMRWFFEKKFGQSHDYELSKVQKDEINTLAQEKFRTSDWVFGYAPSYKYNGEFMLDTLPAVVALEVLGGVVSQSVLKIHDREFDSFFNGLKHVPSFLEEAIGKLELSTNQKQQLLQNLF